MFGFAMLLPSAGAAQLPPICDEYPHLPVCAADAGGGPGSGTTVDDDGRTDDGRTGGGTGGGAVAAAAIHGGGDGGALPFTGYPLSLLLLLLLLLLATGIAIRAWLAYRERNQGSPPGRLRS